MGALVGIQNMTWNGKQDLTRPLGQVKLYNFNSKNTGRRGTVVGGYTKDRGLKYPTIQFAGHRVAQDDRDTALDWLKKVVLKC